MRPRCLLTLCAALGSADAQASDKGLKAELVGATVAVLCSTDIARELRPIVEQRHQLAISKMSQEALAARVARMDEQWRVTADRYKAALEAAPLSARLHAVDAAYAREAAAEAWRQARSRCPKRAGSRAAAEELTLRRLADLPRAAAPTPPHPDAGP